MDDGDIWFIISTDYKTEDPLKKKINEKYVLIKFFKKELTELTKEERWKLSDAFLEKKHIGYTASRSVTFKSGEALAIDYDPAPKLCFVPDFISHYLVKAGENGNNKKYTILASSPQVKIWQDRARCEAQGASFLYQKIYFLPQFLISLEDDTFLFFGVGSNLILRLDKDLNTHFKPKNPILIQGEYIDRNFFVLDYSIIEKLQSKYISESVPLYQTIHNALLIYLKKQYDHSNEENNDDD